MTGIATNILVRHLVEDDPAQAERVRVFLTEARARGERVRVSVIVLSEAARVLRSNLAKPREAVLAALEQVLHTDVFDVEAEEAVGKALQACRAGPGDFADHLIAQLNLAQGCRYTVSFDRALRKAPGFTLL